MSSASPTLGAAPAAHGAEVAPRDRWLPGRRLLLLAALGLPLALLDGGSGLGFAAVFAFDGVLVLFSWLEMRHLRSRVPRVERHVLDRLVVSVPQNASAEVTVQVPNQISLAGGDVHTQALIFNGRVPDWRLTRAETITIVR